MIFDVFERASVLWCFSLSIDRFFVFREHYVIVFERNFMKIYQMIFRVIKLISKVSRRVLVAFLKILVYDLTIYCVLDDNCHVYLQFSSFIVDCRFGYLRGLLTCLISCDCTLFTRQVSS